jgi:hypothetical protein
MRTVRVLPYVLSAVSLALSSASCWYVIHAGPDRLSLAHKPAVGTETNRLKRLDADVNDLIRVCDILSRHIQDVNATANARIGRVEKVAVGGLLLVDGRVANLAKHVGQDLATLQNQVDASQTAESLSLRDTFEKAFVEQMGRNIASPPHFSDPFTDGFERELGRRAATPPPGVLELMQGRSSR